MKTLLKRTPLLTTTLLTAALLAVTQFAAIRFATTTPSIETEQPHSFSTPKAVPPFEDFYLEQQTQAALAGIVLPQDLAGTQKTAAFAFGKKQISVVYQWSYGDTAMEWLWLPIEYSVQAL